MQKRVRVALIALVLSLSAAFTAPLLTPTPATAFAPDSIDCQYDSFQARYAGTRLVNGRTFDVYRCPSGHETLIPR